MDSFVLVDDVNLTTVQQFNAEKLLKLKGNRYRTSDKIWELENFLLKQHRYAYVITQSPEVKLYITIPYSDKRDDEKLIKLWDLFYPKSDYDRKTIEWQKFSDINLPSGSLSPQYVVVGLAPGYHHNLNNQKGIPGRTLCYGPTSFLIREAMFFFSNEIWFTNMSKSSILDNKNDLLQGDYLDTCLKLLSEEIALLCPQKIVCLGSQVYSILAAAGFLNLVRIFHPAYLVRMHFKKNWYIEHIQERI